MSSEIRLPFLPVEIETAAPRAKEALSEANRRIGYIPNIYAMMANSPGLLATYTNGDSLFRQHSVFTLAEQEVVYLTISHENNCRYCVAVHSTLADTMSKVPPAVTDAIRDSREIPDAKLAGLSAFTRTMVKSRGLPERHDVDAFVAAGYTERHLLDIILAIAVKTLTNYSNHFLQTPVDSRFAPRTWTGG